MRRTTRCALLAGLLALLLGLLFLPLAKGPIDSALSKSAANGLRSVGVSGVTIQSDWADLTLSGPAASKDAALAAIGTMDHRDSVDQVTYVVTDSAQPSGNNSAAADGVQVNVQLNGNANPQTIILRGVVADDAQRATLVSAANNAVGSPNVTDELTIANGTPPAAVGTAVERVGALIGAMSTGKVTGTMDLKNTVLTVRGSTDLDQDATNVNNALKAATAAGVIVEGQVSTGSAPGSGVQDQLRNIALQGITFATGSADLTRQGKATLNKAVDVLDQNANVRIEIAGYTDNTGDPQSNLDLSAARAESVKQYLVSRGIAADRLTTKGYGQANPVADNSTAAGRNANRRIEFTILGS